MTLTRMHRAPCGKIGGKPYEKHFERIKMDEQLIACRASGMVGGMGVQTYRTCIWVHVRNESRSFLIGNRWANRLHAPPPSKACARQCDPGIMWIIDKATIVRRQLGCFSENDLLMIVDDPDGSVLFPFTWEFDHDNS